MTVQLGDAEPAAERAVAVVVEGEERLGLRGPGLPTEQDRLVPVGQVTVDRGEHAPSGLAQSLRVQPPTGAGAGSGGPGHEPLLRLGQLGGTGLGRGLLGGVHDHPHLVHPQRTGRERRPRRGVLLLQQPCDPQSTGHLLARARRPACQPGIGAGLGGLRGHLSPIGLGRPRQPQGCGLRLQSRQGGDRLAQRGAGERLCPEPTGLLQALARGGDQVGHPAPDSRRSGRGSEGSDTHTGMVSNTCSTHKTQSTGPVSPAYRCDWGIMARCRRGP